MSAPARPPWLSSVMRRSRASVVMLTVSAVISALAVFASGNSKAVAHLLDGGAWLANSTASSVSHVGPGGVDATVHLHMPAGRTLKVLQQGGYVYVVDGDGQLARIDQAQLSVSQKTTLAAAGMEVVAGGGRLYAINGVTGTVQSLNPLTLQPDAPAIQLGGPVGAAVVDGSGAAWVAIPRQGVVAEINGGQLTTPRHVAPAGDPLELSVVENVVVSVDPVTARVDELSGPDAGSGQQVPLSPNPSIVAPTSVEGTPVLPVLNTSTDQLGSIALGGGTDLQVDLNASGDSLGAPQIIGNTVYVPDYTSGELLVVNSSTGTVGAPIVVTGHAGQFDVVVNNGMLFVNDASDDQAWIVDGNGTVTPVSKYDPNSPNGDETAPSTTIPPAPPLTAPTTTTLPPDSPSTTTPPSSPPTTAPPTSDSSTTSTTNDGGHHHHPGPTTTTTAPGGSSPGGGSGPVIIPTPGPVGSAPDGSPTNVLATAGAGSATLTWSPPQGWQTLTGYEVAISPGGAPVHLDASATSFTTSGLVNGTSYSFTITAVGTSGFGAPVVSNPVDPGPTSEAPGAVSATAGDTSASVSWAAPANLAPTSYKVTAVPQSGSASAIVKVVAAPSTTTSISGLVDGVGYVFTVAAIFGQTTSATVTSAEVTPTGPPGAPGAVSAAASGDRQVTVVWTPATDNGSTITGYTITGGPSPVAVPGTATSAVIQALTDGDTYTFSVRASNGVGSGPASTASPVVSVSQVPSAPAGVTATASDGAVSLSWSPAAGNGTTVVSYQVTNVTDNTTVNVGDTTSYDAQGLTNGTSYVFRVTATGANGNLGPDAQSSAVVPSGTPGAPTGVAATAQPTSAVVTWAAGASNGTAITSYKVTASNGATQSVTATTATFPESAGATVSFTVVAVGADGLSSPAAGSNSVSLLAPPAAPTIVSLTVSKVLVTLTFTPVSGVTYSLDDGAGDQFTPTGSPVTWSNPSDNGTYTATLTATNAAGSASTTRAWHAINLTCLTSCNCTASVFLGRMTPAIAVCP